MHEKSDMKDPVNKSSDRSFGLVMAGAFGVFAAIAFWKNPQTIAGLWLVGIGALFLVSAMVRPAVLKPVNRIWFKFGNLLHKIISPLVMGAIFFILMTPIGLLMRLIGKDLLNLNIARNEASYWIAQKDDETEPSDMTQQF